MASFFLVKGGAARLLLETALKTYSSPTNPNINWTDNHPLSALHLTTCSLGSLIQIHDRWLHVRSVTLTSSDPVHGSTLPEHISINDTKEEIWRRFILSYFLFSYSSWLSLMLPLSWIIKEPGGVLHFTAFKPRCLYSQVYVLLTANNGLAEKQ